MSFYPRQNINLGFSGVVCKLHKDLDLFCKKRTNELRVKCYAICVIFQYQTIIVIVKICLMPEFLKHLVNKSLIIKTC